MSTSQFHNSSSRRFFTDQSFRRISISLSDWASMTVSRWISKQYISEIPMKTVQNSFAPSNHALPSSTEPARLTCIKR